jgi:hypothetical protein
VAQEMNLKDRLDPKKYTGLSDQATDRTSRFTEAARSRDGQG